MKSLRFLLLFALVLPLFAGAAEPLIKELGIPVKAVNWVRLHPGRGPDGQASLLASMGQNNGGLFVLDIDLATGKCRQFNAPNKEQQYPTAAFRSPQTGILYVGEHTTGHFLRYDPAHPERGLEDLGPIDGEHATFPTGIAEAPDGAIWIGGYPSASFTRFDPKTGEFKRYGSMDDADKYLYPLVGNDGTVAALTKFVHPHLIVLDPATGEKREVGPRIEDPEDKSLKLKFFKGLDGYLYLDSHAGKFRVRGMELETVGYLPAEMPGVHSTYKHDYQETLVMPGGLIASWTDGNEGAGLFKTLTISSTTPGIAPRTLELDWDGGGSSIWLIHLASDGNLYGSSFLPEHIFRTAPDGSGMVNLGRGSVVMGEAYSMKNFSDGTMVFGSYPDAYISLFDPRKPYRFGTDEQANPRDIGRIDEIALRPVGMAVVPELKKADGTVVPERAWIGSLPSYGIWGGTLGWLNPKTLERVSHRNIVQDCAPFSLLWLPESKELLVGMSMEGGTGTQVKAKNGAFVLWDPVEDRAIYTGDFGVKDLPSVLALTPAGPGRAYALLGQTRFAANTMNAGHVRPRIVLLDLARRTVIADSALAEDHGIMPDQAQNTLFAGPDGVYGITERVLYRVKPGTAETEIVYRMPEGDHFETPGPWIDRTFYFASGWKLRSITIP